MLRLAVLCTVFVFVSGQTTVVDRCTINGGERPLNTHVHGCINPPCLLPQLENVVIDVIFRVPHRITHMTTLATATVFFGPFSINLEHNLGPDAVTCNFFTNTFCPLLPQEVVQYRLRMFIESIFPVGTDAIIEFRIVDNGRNNEVVWCIRLPIRIIKRLEIED